jgi:peptidoglycan/LPS O-acetylase OafA/YrhL
VAAIAGWWLIGRFLNHDGPTSIATYGLSALASVMLLFAVLKSDAPLLRIAPFSWIVYLGRISYGLYVFHLFALAVIMQHAVAIGFELRVLSSFVLTVMLAAASYKLLEQPFLRLKKRFSYRELPQASSPDDKSRIGVAQFDPSAVSTSVNFR